MPTGILIRHGARVVELSQARVLISVTPGAAPWEAKVENHCDSCAHLPDREVIEFDHIVPFALGGPSHDPKNIRLLCRAHNQMMSRRSFGARAMKKA